MVSRGNNGGNVDAEIFKIIEDLTIFPGTKLKYQLSQRLKELVRSCF